MACGYYHNNRHIFLYSKRMEFLGKLDMMSMLVGSVEGMVSESLHVACSSLQSLLCDPNPNSPANSEAARMFSENKREYNRRVREIVEQSWTAD